MWLKSIRVGERRDLSLAVREWSRRGLPCILIHGFGDASCVWDHLAVRLATQFRVIAVDLRGHGDSDWDPEARYDTETFVADLADIVSAYGFEEMVLVAHSLGADVAVRFTAGNVSRIRGLVIVDYGPELEKAGIDELVRNFITLPRTFASAEDYVQWLIERRPLADPSQLRHFARCNLRQTSPQALELKSDATLATRSQISNFEAVDGFYCCPGLSPALARIKCPTLVVRGMGSGILRHAVASRMVERTLADGRLTTIPAAGHSVMMDNPVEFSATVTNFLASIAARMAPAYKEN
jgi:pimeloyl-ACP methyl ester carboxylesterase